LTPVAGNSTKVIASATVERVHAVTGMRSTGHGRATAIIETVDIGHRLYRGAAELRPPGRIKNQFSD